MALTYNIGNINVVELVILSSPAHMNHYLLRLILDIESSWRNQNKFYDYIGGISRL